MKKLFISQPVNGESADKILDEQKTAVQNVREMLDEDVDVTVFFCEDQNDLTKLAESLPLLEEADVAYFASGWRNSKRCMVENICANTLNIIIIEAA